MAGRVDDVPIGSGCRPDAELIHADPLENVPAASPCCLVIAGIAAAYAPVLHLRRVEPSGMFATYVDCFERVWADAAPMNTPAPA